MRLLTPSQLEQHQNLKEQDLAQKELNVTKRLFLIERKNNELHDEYVQKTQGLDQEFNKFQEQILQKKDLLTKEVSTLESRKKGALKPIIEREKVCREREETIQNREDNATKAAVSIAERIEEIKENQRLLDEEKKRLEKRKCVILEEEHRVQASFSDLDKTRALFITGKKEWEKVKNQEIMQLMQEKEQVASQKAVNDHERVSIEEDRQLLKQQRERLVSDSSALQAAFAEARKKGIY